MGNILKAFFGNYSKRELKRIQPLCDKVLALEEKYKALSDEDLQAQTPALKERLANGETLDDILPDAFAVCREAAAARAGRCATSRCRSSAASCSIRAASPR